MLVATHAAPPFVLVDSTRLLPRYWATAWAVGLGAKHLAENTLKLRLRHIDAFYTLCDQRFGQDALDKAFSTRNTKDLLGMLEVFYLGLTADPTYKSTAVQSWDAVRGFVKNIIRRLEAERKPQSILDAIDAMGRIRPPQYGRIKFGRALPVKTLTDLLKVAKPGSDRNPFMSQRTQWRNWFILNLLLHCGLRRGEALLLTVDALKHDVHPDSGEVVYWLDVTMDEADDTRATRPSIKTEDSHRQIPVSPSMAELYEQYVNEFRQPSEKHGFLLTSRDGHPLSAESFNKIFEKLSGALSPEARRYFQAQTAGKPHISPHDIRHTCATARYGAFMAGNDDRELAMQRMRAFFGWAIDSKMPEHYARAAVQNDLLRAWNELFKKRVDLLRAI